MNKSQRIYLDTTTNNDANINVRLEQDVSTIEFLSMSLSTEEVYQDFNSNYGVLIGRVIANDGIGIQNAKISIFIPLSDADATDGEIIEGLATIDESAITGESAPVIRESGGDKSSVTGGTKVQ